MDYKRLDKFRYYVGTTAVTVIMREGQPLARGIAVCSYRDTFNLQMGDELSYRRALEACDKQISQEPLIKKETRDEYLKAQYIHLVNSGYKFFSEYQPVLLPRELEILKKL
jgi:predicted secreted protein